MTTLNTNVLKLTDDSVVKKDSSLDAVNNWNWEPISICPLELNFSNLTDREEGGMELWFKKTLLYIVFFIMPKHITKTYLILSLLAFIYSVKGVKFDTKSVRAVNKSVLNVDISKDVLLLPMHTCSWVWSDKILSEPIHHPGGVSTIKDLICSTTEISVRSIVVIADKILEYIPSVFKYKLDLKHKSERLWLRHDIVRTILYSA